jgi:hypothetical protein
MGNVPLNALTGRKGILKTRGYIRPGPFEGSYTLPTVHPSFIQRGQSKYSAALIHDLQKAVDLARDGMRVEWLDYELDPPAGIAYGWAQRAAERLRKGDTFLAFDIETPGKDEDEGELDDDTDPTYTILRIGFSYEGLHALSIPWAPEYMATIRHLMGGAWPKVVWNAGFDVPRLRAQGVVIGGLVHDGMVAWHILHSDLPKGLGFVATFCCPFQAEWKHLSQARPAFYNATDADVELRSFLAIAAELRSTGLWEVYDRDVLQLDPVLRFMEDKGMPIDAPTRLDRAVRLAAEQVSVLNTIEQTVPIAARRYEPKEGYVKTPIPVPEPHVVITVNVRTKRCPGCGALNPTKPHFRLLKKPTAKRPQNPCGGLLPTEQVEPIQRVARLVPFKPSREGLMRYQTFMGRPIPKTRDKKTGLMKPTMDKKAIRELVGKFPQDPLYPAVLKYRDLDKIAGTYIGRPNVEPNA